MTKSYLTERLQDEFDVSRPQQIDLMNKSAEYFRSKDSFSREEFEEDVLEDPQLIASFREYGSFSREQGEMDIVDSFEISAHAVKKQMRIFKSVIKLDKNFHIYVHGNQSLIERGFDEVTGKHFYKVYFDKET